MCRCRRPRLFQRRRLHFISWGVRPQSKCSWSRWRRDALLFSALWSRCTLRVWSRHSRPLLLLEVRVEVSVWVYWGRGVMRLAGRARGEDPAVSIRVWRLSRPTLAGGGRRGEEAAQRGQLLSRRYEVARLWTVVEPIPMVRYWGEGLGILPTMPFVRVREVPLLAVCSVDVLGDVEVSVVFVWVEGSVEQWRNQ